MEHTFPGNGFQPNIHLSSKKTVGESRRNACSPHTNVTVADLRIVTTIHYRCKFTTVTQRLSLHLTFSFHTRLTLISPVPILSLSNHTVHVLLRCRYCFLAPAIFSSLVNIHNKKITCLPCVKWCGTFTLWKNHRAGN